MKKKPTVKRKLYIIQKMVAATNLSEALRNERKATIVEVSLVSTAQDKLEPAVGFVFNTKNYEEE